jgi:Holliday junction DNA helicase RuvA
MIARLTGVLAAKSPTEIIIDAGGVGYGVSIPVSTFEALGEVHSTVSIYTHLHVREDALQLYGFATEEERDVFRALIAVSGIGPKIAQGILSGISAADLKSHILSGNAAALTSIPGVGRKTAERLVMELKDRIGKIESAAPADMAGDGQGKVLTEALLALTSLGYNRAAAERAVRAALHETRTAGETVESLIKAALRHAAK